jgi:anti-sigma factor RsiW
MQCKRIEALLSAYQDGELPAALAQEVEHHLENCAACPAEWRQLQKLVSHLRSLTPTAPALTFSSRVMAALPQPARKRFAWLPTLTYSLTFTLIFILGFLLSISENKPARAQTPLTITAVLLENQNLSLLQVQDRTLQSIAEEDHEQN